MTTEIPGGHAVRPEFPKIRENMPRKNIWTLLLLIGAAGSLVACQNTTDYIETDDWNYRNTTSHAIELIGYESPNARPVDAPVEVTEKIWRIDPHETLEIRSQFSIVRDPVPVPFTCDSVQIIFDGQRMLMCYHRSSYYGEEFDRPIIIEGDICWGEKYNQERLGPHHRLYTYELTEAQYDAATPIDGTTK